MTPHQQAFFIPFGLYILLGMVLIARVLIMAIKAGKTNQAGSETHLPAQAQEVQKQFKIVVLILVLALPIAYLVYHLLGG